VDGGAVGDGRTVAELRRRRRGKSIAVARLALWLVGDEDRVGSRRRQADNSRCSPPSFAGRLSIAKCQAKTVRSLAPLSGAEFINFPLLSHSP